jgi:hypothetical protein
MVAVIPSWVFYYVWASCLFVLCQCVCILVEIYREDKERRRQNNQRSSQPNNAPRLQISQITENGLNASVHLNGINKGRRVDFWIGGGRAIYGKLVKAGNKIISLFRKLSIFTHKRMTPNYYSTTAGSLMQTHSFAKFKSSNSFITNKTWLGSTNRWFVYSNLSPAPAT